MKYPIAAIVAVLLISGCDTTKAPQSPPLLPPPPGGAQTRTETTSPAAVSGVSVFSTDGNWRFGYTAGKVLVPDDFRTDAGLDAHEVVHFWHPTPVDQPNARYYPYVARNMGDHVDGNHGWAVRPGEFAMEASADGQYSLAIFTPHHAGLHHIDARFEGIHFNLLTTDVHILHNGHDLFAADIDGYGGDPAFHPIVGSNPAATFSRDVDLKEGDTLTFAVGVGRNGTHFCDTTGLIATITAVPAAK